MVPMLEQMGTNMAPKLGAVGADAGYWSETNATHETMDGIDLLIATVRMNHRENITTESMPPREHVTPKQAMHHKLAPTQAGHL